MSSCSSDKRFSLVETAENSIISCRRGMAHRLHLALHPVSIVIPAYNEERRLPSSLDAILAWVRQPQFSEAEIVVIDDGSTDGTADVVRLYAERDPMVRLVSNPGNRGKGYSVRNGML